MTRILPTGAPRSADEATDGARIPRAPSMKTAPAGRLSSRSSAVWLNHRRPPLARAGFRNEHLLSKHQKLDRRKRHQMTLHLLSFRHDPQGKPHDKRLHQPMHLRRPQRRPLPPRLARRALETGRRSAVRVRYESRFTGAARLSAEAMAARGSLVKA